ncbi:MAG: hypothetical protein O3A33_14140 [Chloroflexi bacterium]|nr:hypothetical protein [Chloroflexota bacterium]
MDLGILSAPVRWLLGRLPSKPQVSQTGETDSGGDVTQVQAGRDIQGGVHIHQGETRKPDRISNISVQGDIIGVNKAVLMVGHDGVEAHSFRVQLQQVRGGIEVDPNKFLPVYLQWDSSPDNAAETIGPDQSAVLMLADIGGHTQRATDSYTHLNLSGVNTQGRRKGKLWTGIPWGKEIEIDLEIQSDSGGPEKQIWSLSVDSQGNLQTPTRRKPIPPPSK